jgi:hypothetical protein
MDQTYLTSILPLELYHSYVVETGTVDTVETLCVVLEQRGNIEHASPDVLCQTYDAFTIADSREIKDWHRSKGLTSGKKVCIISAKFINNEAQQSLLKIIEEPHEGTHFFLLIPHASTLLDTIRSRVHIITAPTEAGAPTTRAVAFLKASAKDRLDSIARIIEAYKTTDNSGALRHEATELLAEIELAIYSTIKKNIRDPHTQFVLGELSKGRKYLSTSGASAKMILEHIALVI